MRVGVFKKIALVAGAGAAVLAVGAAGGVGTYYLIEKIKDDKLTEYIEKNISSEKQVKTLLGASNADGRFLMKLNNRLPNNQDEPIYVAFEDEFYKEENQLLLNTSISVMDTFFDIVHDINPKYTYKIISSSELTEKKYGDKAAIKFYYDQIESTESKEIFAKVNYADRWRLLTINSSTDELVRWNNRDEIDLTRTLVHEFDHIFNIDDIYNFTDAHVETAVDTKYYYYSNPLTMPTPNDYACFLSMYAPNMTDLELANYIDTTMPEKINNYKQKYYNAASNDWLDYKQSELYSFPTDFKEETFVVSWNMDVCGYLKVKVENDKYFSTLYNSNKEYVSSCEGKVFNADKHIFFEDMYFPYGIYTEEEGGQSFERKAMYQTMGLSYYDGNTYFKPELRLLSAGHRFSVYESNENIKSDTQQKNSAIYTDLEL